MDFVQVMKDWRRMCNSVPGKSEFKSLCSDKESGYVCPLKYNGLCCKAIASQTDEDIISGENIIAAWAAEHPEPVYPTWAEWLVDSGVFPQMMSTIPSVAFNTIRDSLSVEIPADTAQKLGIEPKEV